MTRTFRQAVRLSVLLLVAWAAMPAAQSPPAFEAHEATIAQIHAAMRTEQMKMFLTRLGFTSKTVVTGDVTQIDLPSGKNSGLVEVQKILEGIEGIRFVYFTNRDVVRHKLVQKIIKAYEKHEGMDEQEN